MYASCERCRLAARAAAAAGFSDEARCPLALSQSFSLILSLFLTRSGALPSSLFFPELRMDAAAVVSVAAVSSGASSDDSSFRQLIN